MKCGLPISLTIKTKREKKKKGTLTVHPRDKNSKY